MKKIETNIEPIELKEVIIPPRKGLILKVKGELTINPILEEDEYGEVYFTYENDDLGISIYSARRLKEFKKELNAQIDMLWHEYALCPDNELSKDAIILKQNLLNTFEEVNPKKISFDFDSSTDTAYFSLVGLEVDSYVENVEGWVLRYCKNNQPQGVTIMDFNEEIKRIGLRCIAKKLSNFLDVSRKMIHQVIIRRKIFVRDKM